eukprot:350572-Chlamydomonas_euryale.AAC.5
MRSDGRTLRPSFASMPSRENASWHEKNLTRNTSNHGHADAAAGARRQGRGWHSLRTMPHAKIFVNTHAFALFARIVCACNNASSN